MQRRMLVIVGCFRKPRTGTKSSHPRTFSNCKPVHTPWLLLPDADTEQGTQSSIEGNQQWR